MYTEHNQLLLWNCSLSKNKHDKFTILPSINSLSIERKKRMYKDHPWLQSFIFDRVALPEQFINVLNHLTSKWISNWNEISLTTRVFHFTSFADMKLIIKSSMLSSTLILLWRNLCLMNFNKLLILNIFCKVYVWKKKKCVD
jgi:hypothetical protein